MPGMTSKKAIEILADSAYLGSTTFDQDFYNAEKLGMEALKRLEALRDIMVLNCWSLLPGETES